MTGNSRSRTDSPTAGPAADPTADQTAGPAATTDPSADAAPGPGCTPAPGPEPLAPDELAERMAEVFALVGPLYRRAFRKVEGDAPGAGLTIGVRAVLDLLEGHGPMTVPQMGRAQALSRQFVQRMVNEARERGLVESVPNPAHRRSVLIRPTDKGAAAIAAVHAQEHAAMRSLGGELTAADVDSCLKVLGGLLSLFDDVDVDGPACS